MARRGTVSLLVAAVAVSSTGWNLYTSAQATQVPFQWIPTLVAVLPYVVAVVAAVALLRASAWWRRAALAYAAAFAALESLGLVQIWPFASQFETVLLVWSVATSALALVATVLAVVILRDGADASDGGIPGLFRWAATAAGALIMASSMVAWTVTSHAPSGRWTSALSHAWAGVLVGTFTGMAVVAGITAVVAASSQRALVVGATGGLLASRPLAIGVLADRTWQDADAILAAGWWLALAAQVLLVIALAGLLVRRTDDSRMASDLAPTS